MRFVKQDFMSVKSFLKAIKREKISKKYLNGEISLNEQNKKILRLYKK